MGPISVPEPPCGTEQCRRLLDQLGEAVASRDVIGQAKGIIMERHRVTADEAFGGLRRASQSFNIKLTDLATDLTITGTFDARWLVIS